MKLEDIYNSSFPATSFIQFVTGEFTVSSEKAHLKDNRITLAHFFEESVRFIRENFRTESEARIFVRFVWREEIVESAPWDLPIIVGEDGFIRFYAEGHALSISLFKRIWKHFLEGPFEISTFLKPIYMDYTKNPETYFDVKATPPGLLAKFFYRFRMKKDSELLEQVQSDLKKISFCEESEKRKLLTLAILSHGASYRELDGEVLYIPSFLEKDVGKLIPYSFRHHLLWEGIKTVSALPLEKENEEPGIYLCQGTEIWPSQPSMLGSLFANLGKEGSATEPYAYCWKQIHKHLRALKRDGGPLPLVTGHSMGGSLTIQIALYSHMLISKAYAFNPPGVEERDYRVYHRLSEDTQKKLLIFANLDDLPFWRMGSKVIGRVTVFLTARRWKYRPVKRWELLLILPALIKALINMVEAFPSHQNIYALSENYLVFPLSQEELEKENLERVLRPDHLFLFRKFHPSFKAVLSYARRHFHWKKYDEYLLSQIEILDLHEQDLKDTLLASEDENESSLKEIKRQKELLLRELQKDN